MYIFCVTTILLATNDKSSTTLRLCVPNLVE